MRIAKDVTINGREITVNELTVAEVVKIIESIESGLIDLMFDGRLPLSIVSASSGIKKKEFDKWFPSDLDKLINEVEAVNPHSARLCKTLVSLTGRAEGQK